MLCDTVIIFGVHVGHDQYKTPIGFGVKGQCHGGLDHNNLVRLIARQRFVIQSLYWVRGLVIFSTRPLLTLGLVGIRSRSQWP
jgi:hypothetical protein